MVKSTHPKTVKEQVHTMQSIQIVLTGAVGNEEMIEKLG